MSQVKGSPPEKFSTEPMGIIEELRKQAAMRTNAANDSTQLLRALRDYPDIFEPFANLPGKSEPPGR